MQITYIYRSIGRSWTINSENKWDCESVRGILCHLDPDTVDIARFMDCLAAHHVNTLITTLMSGGYAYFNNSRTSVHPKLKNEHYLKDLINEGHRHNIKIVGAIDVTRNGEVAKEHPNWVQRAVDEPGDRPLICLNSPYREYMVDILGELCASHDIDGIWLDMVGFFPYRGKVFCYCDHCKERFGDEYDADLPRKPNWTDPTWRNFVNWHYSVVNGFLSSVQKVIKQKNPNQVVSINYYPRYSWAYGHDLKDLCQYVDVLTVEAFPKTLVQPLWYIGEIAKLAQATTDKPVWVIIQTHHGWWFQVPVPKQEIATQVYEATANLASPILYTSYGFLEHYPHVFESIAETFRVTQIARRHMRNVRTIKYCAILYSQQTRDWYGKFYPELHVNCVKGVYRALIEEGMPAKTITDQYLDDIERISGFDVIVLPNAVCLSNEQIATIENYVRMGGGIVATFLTSLAYENGEPRENYGLSRVLGVDYVFPAASSASEVNVRLSESHEITEGLVGDNLFPYRGVYPLVREHSTSNVIGKSTSPVFVVHESGKGKAFFSAGQIDSLYWLYGVNFYRKLLINAVKWAAGKEPPVQVKTPGVAEVCAYIGMAGRDILINCVNLNSNPLFPCGGLTRSLPHKLALLSTNPQSVEHPISIHSSTKGICSTINEIIPVHNLEIVVRASEEPEKCNSLINKQELKLSRRDQLIVIEVPVLKDYDVFKLATKASASLGGSSCPS